MSDKLHKTRGIVLRTVKYGETSVIVSVLTGLFGLQSYLVNGVRTSSKKESGKAGLFQPAAILDLVVYHNELRHLNRIREFKWAEIYRQVFSDVPRNAVALFMVELLSRCLKQPESNPELYQFTEDVFLKLDESEGTVMANLPLFFALHLPVHFGLRIGDNHNAGNTYLDLQEGLFMSEPPHHPHYLEGREAAVVSQFLKVMQPGELEEIRLGSEFRRKLLHRIETYYAIHIQDFTPLKTLPVLNEILH